MAIRYFWDKGNRRIEINDDYCRWGVVYDNCISAETFEKMNYLERYDSLAKYAVISKEDTLSYSFFEEEDVVRANYQEYPFLVDGEIVNEIDLSCGKKRNLSIEPVNNCEFFLYADGIEWSSDILYGNLCINNKYIELINQRDLFFKVTPDSNGEIALEYDTGGTCKLYNVKVYKYEIDSMIKELQKKNTCSNVCISNDSISGIVKGKNKILCFPCFYDEHWVASINGDEVPIIKINNGLCGIITTDEINEYDIGYKYIDVLIKCSIISIISILITMVWMIMDNKKAEGRINE